MKFRWTTRILFIDTDASGRIHYTCLFRYFEAAEIEFFRAVGVLRRDPVVAYPRVHVECDYRTPIGFDDEVVFEVTVGRLGNTSIRLDYRVFTAEVEAACGKVVIAWMDRQTQRAALIPDSVREKFQPYVNG